LRFSWRFLRLLVAIKLAPVGLDAQEGAENDVMNEFMIKGRNGLDARMTLAIPISV
jgi:hypothetical protein